MQKNKLACIALRASSTHFYGLLLRCFQSYYDDALQNVIVKDEFETLHERINDQREFYKLKVIHGGVYYQARQCRCMTLHDLSIVSLMEDVL